MSISAMIGCAPQTLNDWAKKAEVESGKRAGVSSEMVETMKALERELRLANGILRGVSVFCDGGAGPPAEVMVGFIDAHRDAHGVEPLCPRHGISDQWRSHGSMRPIASSPFCDHRAKRADPSRLSDRSRRDKAFRLEILRGFEESWRVHGVRKVWRQLGRDGFDGARCPVARRMKSLGIQGTIRGKPHRTTFPDEKAPCPLDGINRQFRVPAPNMLWVSDFTHVALVIDTYARKIVGWRVSSSAHAGFVLDAVEQAVHDRAPERAWGWFITATGARKADSTCPCATPSAWRKPVSTPRRAASATGATTPWPRRSMACSRLRSTTDAAHGAA
jgi:hypothetical protein